MEFKDVLEAVRRFRLLSAAVVLLFLAMGAAAVLLPHPKYKASATLIAEPGPKVPVGDAGVPTIEFMLPSIVQQVGTQAFQEAVLKRDPQIADAPDLSIGATQAAGTGILYVTAMSRNAAVVVNASNAAAKELADHQLSPLVQLQLLDPAHGVASASRAKAPILAAALVLGLMAAVLTALTANALRRTAVEEGDIESIFGLEVLGEIPKRDTPSPLIANVFASSDFTQLSEAFQKVAANLQTAGILGARREIAIVSCSGEEGKTTIASGLAFALALNGQETLLIDADLRRPTLHSRFGLRRTPGLGDASSARLGPGLRQVVRKNLTVIAAGQADQHPTNIITRRLPELLRNDGFSHESVVLVDTPPLAGIPEAILICHFVSCVILVVEPGRTYRSVLERVLHDLRRADVEVVGVVLNRVTRSSGGQHYSPYYDAIADYEPASAVAQGENRPSNVGWLRAGIKKNADT